MGTHGTDGTCFLLFFVVSKFREIAPVHLFTLLSGPPELTKIFYSVDSFAHSVD